MAITYLKQGKPEAERAEDDAKVRAVVETTLADIDSRGDAAVRDLSQKFDGYAPDRFRLTASDIEAAMQKVSTRDLEDIRPGGLGVHLIEEIMDSVHYEHRDGGGMRLTMRKRIPVEETN